MYLHGCLPCAHSCGGAAILLSNKVFDGFRAKYKLLHTIRTQNAREESLNCVVQQEDGDGNRGVHLSKDITLIAGRALTTNLTMLGYVSSHALRKCNPRSTLVRSGVEK